jgi:heptosyltransferase-2
MPDRVIVRLPNWLGDTVMAEPALRAIRHAFPEARVLAAGPWAPALAGQGLADVLLGYPRGWAGRLRSADRAREFRADVAVLLPNSLESALAARYWRARRRVGFAGAGRAWLLTDSVPPPVPRLHQVDEYLVLARTIGATANTTEPRLAAPAPDGDERREARGWLGDAGVADARPLVGIHLGAAYGSAKVWPPDRVAALVRDLARRDVTAVLLGPASDAAAAHTIVEATGAASLVGRDRPARLTALLAEVDVLVAGDTGVAHLAAALGTPVVALFGPTDPALSAPRGRVAVVRHAVPCAPCSYRTCPIDHPCMRGIDPRAVADRAVALATAGVAS